MSVTEIVIAAQRGDKSALQKLYDMYLSEVYVVVKSIIQDEHETEDITHDVFVTVIEKISELNSPECFRSWLRSITVNKCRKFLRDRHEYVTDDAETGSIEVIANTDTGDFSDILPCEHLDSSETNKILYKAISELSEKHKTVIFMHYYCNMPLNKIAEELDISVGTVKSRLNYARKTLEKKLTVYEKQGIKLHSMDIFSGMGNLMSNISHTTQIPKSLYSAVQTAAYTSGHLTSTAVSSAVSSVTAHTISNAAATKISVGTSAAAVVTVCTVLVTSSSPPPETTPPPYIPPVSETMQISETSPEISAESAIESIIESYIESSLEESMTSSQPPEPVIIKETSIVKEIVVETSIIEKEIEKEVEKEVEKIVTDVVHDTEYIEVERQIPEKDFSDYYTAEDENYKYIIYPSVNEATLSQFKTDSVLSENIIIPDNINDIPVTEIGSNAFESRQDIISVAIPDSIKTISPCAFEWCMHIEQVQLGENIENIGTSAFSHCLQLKEISFPEKLRYIGNSAFSKCPLEKVTFGNRIQTIASNAFSDTNINELDFKNSPMTVETDAFRNCTQLKKIRFSPYTQFVMDNFSTCKALEEIQLFYNNIDFWHYSYKIPYKDMPELKKVDITVCDGVKSIDENFFTNFCVDTRINIVGSPKSRIYSNLTPFNIISELGELANDERIQFFSDYSYINTVQDEFSFRNSNVQLSVTLPDSLEYIGSGTFRNYTHLHSITIPQNVSFIDKDTFFNCFDLKEINILNPDISISSDSGLEYTSLYRNQSVCEELPENSSDDTKNISEN